MFTVYYSHKGITENAGFGMVAHLPCIMDSRPGYHRLASQFLIDRGLNLWHPITRGRAPRGGPLTNQSLKNTAEWLINFLEWAEIRGIDNFTCDYETVIKARYQDEMIKGVWSRDGVPLSPATVNLRVQTACDYLVWMWDKGFRGPFHIPYSITYKTRGSATNSKGHLAVEVKTRIGKVRPEKRKLRMPTDSEVAIWLNKIYQKFGYTKGLMCESVLYTAMRRMETACWRFDTLPENPLDWHIVKRDAPREEQRVLIDIKFGTKGKVYGYDHGDKVGPTGEIYIPLKFAEKIHDYRNRIRNGALRKWIKGAKTVTEQKLRISDTVHLFLCEKTGRRITSSELYRIWTGVELPFKGWSPHLGRDYWACTVLLKEVERHEFLLKLGVNVPETLLASLAMNVIRLQIQPQLRHSDETTSMGYVVWASQMIGKNLAINYDAELENFV